MFGNYVRSKVEAVEGKNPKDTEAKQDRVLRRLLGLKQQFRQPPSPGRKTVKL